MELIETHICHGGTLQVYTHHSSLLGCAMKFSIFLPPNVLANEKEKNQPVPLVTYLSGLTCTHDNFTSKGGGYAFAAREGIAIVAPDTSPRGDNLPDDPAFDFGQGAGFYINATEQPWSKHFMMEDYVVEELNALVCKTFPVLADKQGITGHSMGGHGALTLGLKYPERFVSLSAFAPIVAPSQVPWGQKAFSGYLGSDQTQWGKHDACALMVANGKRKNCAEILIDQGTADNFLHQQLKPHVFQDACRQAEQKLRLRMQDGYDHSYYFIQSFIEDHIVHHATILRAYL